MPMADGRYQGPLYRALNPVYAREPLSGRGAERYGGRFNPVGLPALYTALDPATALREAHQVGSLQPTILVSYHADLGPVFDTGDAEGLTRFGLSEDDLADPGWRTAMLDGRRVATQEFASALIAAGYLLGANWHRVEPYTAVLQYVIVVAVVVSTLWFVVSRLRRNRPAYETR